MSLTGPQQPGFRKGLSSSGEEYLQPHETSLDFVLHFKDSL